MTPKLLVSLGGCVFALTPTFSGDLKMLATSMLLRRTAPRVAPVAARSFPMGPAAGGTISDELLDKLLPEPGQPAHPVSSEIAQ